MQNVFISSGGHGTTFLLTCFQKEKYKVGTRPDAVFKRVWDKIVFKTGYKYQTIRSLDELPVASINKDFRKRSGIDFGLDNQKSINDNLLEYLNQSELTNNIVLFNIVYSFRFFSSNNISNVIALVRHPLHAYLSFVKPQRHERWAEAYGGVNSVGSIVRHLSLWNDMVSEAIKASMKIIRYEFFYEDAAKAGLDTSVFDKHGGWDTSKRNENSLTDENTDFLYDRAKDNYFKIYDKWEI